MILISTCNTINNKIKMTSYICYNAFIKCCENRRIDVQIRTLQMDLIMMRNVVHQIDNKFTANNFFVIDLNTLTKIFSITIMNVIIVYQFYFDYEIDDDNDT